METYYNIHNIVKIKIRTKNPEIIKECEYYFRNFKITEEPENLNIKIRDFDEFLLPKTYFNISNASYGFKNGIYNQKDSYAVEIENNKMTLYIKGNNLCINSLIEYILLQNNCTFIHGAGISYKNKGIVFPAPPDSGKTLLISKLREKSNIKFFADDYLILRDNGTMYSYPMDFSIYDYHFNFFTELKKSAENRKIKRAKYEKILVNMIKDLPQAKKILKQGARLLKYDFLKGGEYLKIPAQRLISKEKFGTSVDLKYSIFLSKYNGNEFKVEKMKLESVTKEILGILQNEWHNTMPVYHLLSCFGVLDFSDYLNDIKNIINKGFNNLKLYRVLVPINMDNKELLEKLEKFLDQEIFNYI